MDYDLDEWKMILAPSALIIFILWDIVFYVAKDYLNAKVRSWVPSNLFVLSALTIQILSYVDIQKVNVFGPSDENDMEVLVDNQLRMDLARLTMCVFVGCLLPAMATVGTVGKWSNVAALFVSLSFHIATEIYALQYVHNYEVQSEAGPWFMASGVLLLVGASSLLLLLGEVILFGKYLRDVIRPHDMDAELQGCYKWKMLRSEVMKSWVVARAWKTRYFIASSMFNPGALMIITICVAVMGAKLSFRSSLLHHNHAGGNLTFYLQCIFIFVGWALMVCRWFKAAFDCQSLNTIVNFSDIVRVFLMPSAIVVRQLNRRLAYFLLHPGAFSILEFKKRNILISLSCGVPLLPLGFLVLAITLVLFFCFISWYLSDLVFGSTIVKKLFKHGKNATSVKEEYCSILNATNMDEDAQRAFWMMNANTFVRVKQRMVVASENAQSCEKLHSVLGNSKLDQNQRLCKVDGKQSWMRAISSIFTHIVQLKIGVDMQEAIDAYWETNDVLKFVDCPDNIVVDFFNIFGTLNVTGFMNSINCEGGMLIAERELKEGLGTSPEEKRERERDLRPEERPKVDAMLEEIRKKLEAYDGSASNNLLIKLDNWSYNNIEGLGEMLRTLVGHVIVSALLEASDVIVKYTKQWAKNLDEGKIERAVELAGKVSGLLEKLVDEDIEAGA